MLVIVDEGFMVFYNKNILLFLVKIDELDLTEFNLFVVINYILGFFLICFWI
jgi:hypothetical protein